MPDLLGRIAQKDAEIREARASLHLLEVGPRPEAVAEKRLGVQRAKGWRDLAEKDLERPPALQGELSKLDHMIEQNRAELDEAETALGLALKLLGKGALSHEQYRQAQVKRRVSRSRQEQVKSEKQARMAQGTLEFEGELARRDKEFAEARSALALLEAGPAPRKSKSLEPTWPEQKWRPDSSSGCATAW